MNLSFLQSPHGEEPVLVSGLFKASPDRVFRAWTDEGEIEQWFGPGPGRVKVAEIDLRVGGNWRFDFGLDNGRRDVLFGQYLQIEMGQRLVFSYAHERTLENGRVETTQTSQVSITFEPSGEDTFVRLMHERIVRLEGRLGVGEGWCGTFANLERRFISDATIIS